MREVLTLKQAMTVIDSLLHTEHEGACERGLCLLCYKAWTLTRVQAEGFLRVYKALGGRL